MQATKTRVLPLVLAFLLVAALASQFHDSKPRSVDKGKRQERVIYLTALSPDRDAVVEFGMEPGLEPQKEPIETDSRHPWKKTLLAPVGTVVWVHVLPNLSKMVAKIGCGVSRRGQPGMHKIQVTTEIYCAITVD